MKSQFIFYSFSIHETTTHDKPSCRQTVSNNVISNQIWRVCFGDIQIISGNTSDDVYLFAMDNLILCSAIFTTILEESFLPSIAKDTKRSKRNSKGYFLAPIPRS